MRKEGLVLIILFLILIPIVNADFGYNTVEQNQTFGYNTEEAPSVITFLNYTNISEYWKTTDGILDNVPDIPHNNLGGLQGGQAGQYYHINLSWYSELLVDIFNWVTQAEGDARYLLNTGDIATGNYTFDTSTLFIDSSLNRVGIGTASPDSAFHIKANIPGIVGSHSAGQLIIQNPTDSVFSNVVITGYESDGSGNPDQQLWYLGSSSGANTDIIFLNRRNAKLQLGTNGVAQMTILGSGNVGIGTTAPAYLLDASKAQNAATYIQAENTDAASVSSIGGFRAKASTATAFLAAHGAGRIITRYGITVADYAELLTTAGNGLLIGSNQAVPIIFGTNDLERMRILSGGNVGIGTATPQNPLNVVGSVNQTNGNLTGDMIYAEMWNYSSNATAWAFDIDVANVYYNLTNLTMTKLHGFTYTNNVQSLGGSYLTAQTKGYYRVCVTFSFEASQSNALYGIGLAKNFDITSSRNCYSRRWATQGNAGNVNVNCILQLDKGDTVNIQLENEQNNRDIKVHTANVNLVRIGN